MVESTIHFKSVEPVFNGVNAKTMNPNKTNVGTAWICVLIFVTSVAGPLTHRSPAEPASRPNVIVVLTDDLGYGDLSSYGHPHIRTPHLDRMAKNGLRLTSCYAAAPVCSPSRAGLVTGRTPSRTGVYDWISSGNRIHLPEREVTVAERLKEAGYQTAQFGKWHLNGKFNKPAQPQPGDHGFDHWFATQNNARPSHQNPKNFVRNGEAVGKLDGFSCQLVADEAIRWMENKNDEESPFFLYVAFHEPHEPVESPDDLVKTYMDEAENRDEAEYFANVTNMDAAVGRLIAHLKKRNLDENTLVWFTSDNGPETLNRYGGADRSYGSPGPLRGMKLWLYEGGIRVPGILWWPGHIDAGRVDDRPVSGVDVLPTLCDLAGVEPPQDRTIDGTSIKPLLEGDSVEREKPLFWHYYRAIGKPKTAMRIGPWMVLGHWDGPSRGNIPSVNHDLGTVSTIKSAGLTSFELYNLRSDLRQRTDLSEKRPERRKTFAERLRKTYRDVREEGVPWHNR